MRSRTTAAKIRLPTCPCRKPDLLWRILLRTCRVIRRSGWISPRSSVLIGFVGICFLAAMTGAMFRPGDWYERLRKPAWRPPNWVFPPAWAFLYLTIAVSGWLAWRTSGFAGAAPIFFGMRRPDLAFIEVVMLWLSIIATIAAFHRVNAAAAWLLLPYLAWVTFAAALNCTIWRLNRGPVWRS